MKVSTKPEQDHKADGLNRQEESGLDTSKLNDWLQVVGLFGVIASLVFVGLQMKQDREIAIADAYQQRAAMAIELFGSQLPPDRSWSAYSKAVLTDEPLSDEETMAMAWSFIPTMAYYENNYFQYQSGLLDQQHWESSLAAIGWLARYTVFRDWWLENGQTYRQSFKVVVDAAIAEEPVSKRLYSYE